MEIVLAGAVLLFVVLYRKNNGTSVYKFFKDTGNEIYEQYAPYSYKVMHEKIKELGLEYTTRQYVTQIIIFAGIAGAVGYVYFYSIPTAIIYAAVAVAFIPYVTYLRCKRQYSEFIFEQIQVYTTNTIMEFSTTQAFVKSLEGVVQSGVLEEPVLSDVKTMIAMSYENGDVEESINYMNAKYPFYMVKNMHQLFLQVTKEGAKNTGDTFDNMLSDIDALVEGVYRDRADRKTFHGQFIMFGVALYGLPMLIQLLVGSESYIGMINGWLVPILLHIIVIVNTGFLLNGEKFYNENVGAE